jgi:hypothetical protein
MKKRAVIAVSGESMDKKHFYSAGSHSGSRDDLPSLAAMLHREEV